MTHREATLRVSADAADEAGEPSLAALLRAVADGARVQALAGGWVVDAPGAFTGRTVLRLRERESAWLRTRPGYLHIHYHGGGHVEVAGVDD